MKWQTRNICLQIIIDFLDGMVEIIFNNLLHEGYVAFI